MATKETQSSPVGYEIASQFTEKNINISVSKQVSHQYVNSTTGRKSPENGFSVHGSISIDPTTDKRSLAELVNSPEIQEQINKQIEQKSKEYDIFSAE